MTNDRLYLHELIDIIGHNRAKYMHHMTANWSPIAQEERNQLCFGVWGTLGSTTNWPQVVNIWEEAGYDGLAAALGRETARPQLQDEKLEKWWAEASNYRRGGYDRLMLPAPWMRTITELCADGVRGDVYFHETIKVQPGTSAAFLGRAHDEALPAYEALGATNVAALRTVMHNDDEVVLIWALADWAAWAEFEKATETDAALIRWKQRLWQEATDVDRFIMNDAELAPLKLGRQPARSDRHEGWTDL